MSNKILRTALGMKAVCWIVFFALFLSLSWGQGAYAQSAVDRVSPQVIQALRAINQGQWDQGRRLINEAGDPTATKLYYWLWYTKQETDDDLYPRLVQFVRQNSEWPRINKLRLKIEQTMPNDLRPSDVTGWFDDFAPLTANGLERYLEALLLQGKIQTVRTVLQEWWIKPLFTPQEQRQIYSRYKAYLPVAAHQKRLDILLLSGRYTNGRALAQVLGAEYPALTEARIALARQGPDVNALLAPLSQKALRDPGLLYERLRWRRRNDMNEGALEILNQRVPAKSIHNPKDWWLERHIMVRRMIEAQDYRTAYGLSKNHVQKEGLPFAQAEWLSGWLALRFLNAPMPALRHFERLYKNVKTPVSLARAAYWGGRAHKQMGNKSQARAWFKRAAQYQTVFYGQMAGVELGQAAALSYTAVPQLSINQKNIFYADPLVRAALWLGHAKMKGETSAFMRAFLNENSSPEGYKFAADFFSELGQYKDAVNIAKKATKKGLFLTAQAYPVITAQIPQTSVEHALIHSIIRQESIFDPEAKSPAGARGLMQLMPATAKETARKIGVAHSRSWLTGKPEHNIQLGSAYLDQMVRRFGGFYPLAIAAYNAGPGRVDRWLKMNGDPRVGQVNLIDWIEMIPIYETRNYVQRVLESVHVYRLRLDGDGMGRLPNIHTTAFILR